MPIKFASNVTTRVSTVNLERQLLHYLLLGKLNLQQSMGKHRSEFFTNQSRLFIYDCINTTFNEKRIALSDEQFEFEIQKRFDSTKDKTRIDDFTSEFDLVKKTQITEDIDVILQNLEEVQLANSTESLIREAYSKLESGSYVEAADILKKKSIDLGGVQKENKIYNLHKDSDDWFAEVRRRKEHPEIYAGIPTGFKTFDEKTGGLFPAELTVVFGLSGKGKSTLMKAIACNIRKSGRNVLHCGNEENEFQMRSKYMSSDSGALYSVFKKGTYTDDQYFALKKYSDGERNAKGNIFIYEFPQQTDATWIERAYHQLEMQGIHIDVIVVDYLDLMKPCEKAYSENDEGGKVTSDLKQVAINCNVPLITATQAGIQSEKQEKKERPFLNQSDVFGTKRKVHSANTLIGIVNQTATAQAQELTEEQREMHHLVLCVPKNRDGAVFVFRQKMHTPTGRFFEEDGDSKDEAALQSIAVQAQKMCDDTLMPGDMVSEISVDAIYEAKKKDLEQQMEALKKEHEMKKQAVNNQTENTEKSVKANTGETSGEIAKSIDVVDSETTDENDPLFGGIESSSSETNSVEEKQEEQEKEDPFLTVDEEDASETDEEEQPEEETSESPDDFLDVEESSEKQTLESIEEKKEEPKSESESNSEPKSEQIEEKKEEPEETPTVAYGGADPLTSDEPLMPFDKPTPYSEKKEERTADDIPHKKSFLEILKERKAKGEKL